MPSKSEVSIMHLCQLCSSHYTAKKLKNCMKSTSAATTKYMDGAARPLIIIGKVNLLCQLFSTCYTPIQTSLKAPLYCSLEL